MRNRRRSHRGARAALTARLAAILLAAAAPAAWAVANLSTYATEAQAQQHCPHDVVVWLSVSTATYAVKAQRWYGRGKNSVYACKGEADAAGARNSPAGP